MVLLTLITTSSKEFTQEPDNVHRKVLFPFASPDSLVVGLMSFANVALPETTVHFPLAQALGAIAPRVAVVEQTL